MNGLSIYIASSWKNQHAVEMLTAILRQSGHKVASFVEMAVIDEGRAGLKFDVVKWIDSKGREDKFNYDTESAMNSDLVIYIGPSGCDAWAEIGAAYGAGVTIFGLIAKGEQIGLMRRMVTWFDNVGALIDAIDVKRVENTYQQEP